MDEIEGFASVLSGGTVNELGDGKLSRDEFLVVNFTPDVCTAVSCSSTAVFGSRSATGQTNRWANFNTLLPQEGDTVDIDRVRTIMSYHKPGAGGMDPGDIYNIGTIQSMAYSFSDNRLELWLGTFVDNPQYVTVSIPFLEDQ